MPWRTPGVVSAPQGRLAPGDSIFDQYVMSAPTPQAALDIFEGEWSSRLPGPLAGCRAGTIPLFEDGRVAWAFDLLGGVDGQRVLDLGPLEGGHPYLAERHGAAEVVAVEANTRAYLKCLIVKELLGLRTRFLLGDFVGYLRETSERFDLCLASGVLYHMRDPLEMLELAGCRARALYVWTHYYDAEIIGASPVLAPLFTDHARVERDGLGVTYHRRMYPKEARQMAGFCGGGQPFAHWLSRGDVLRAVEHAGFQVLQTGIEEPQHPNGPAFALVARRPAG